MTTLLHLDTSISHATSSVSRQLTELFARTWKQRHGCSGYRYRDLADQPIPLAGPAYATLGHRVERHGVLRKDQVASMPRNAAEQREWALTAPLIDELLASDTVVIGVPMYNFSIPASLKAWIDRVTFPGAFLDPDAGGAATNRLRGTRVVVITARGGAYGPGTPRESFEFQTPYLLAYFTDLGIAQDSLHFVHAELTRVNDIPALAPFRELSAASWDAARASVIELASSDGVADARRTALASEA